MKDYDTLDSSGSEDFTGKYKSNDDFPSIFTDIFKCINWKIAIFLYLICIFIHSDIFIELFLSREQVNGDCPNDKGTMVQITSIAISYIMIDIMVQGGFI